MAQVPIDHIKAPRTNYVTYYRRWGLEKVQMNVTPLDLNELPTEPLEARKAFKRAYGFQVRDNISITIQDWRLMPETTKEQLWRNITEKIKYLDGIDEECVNNATFISMGQLFHRSQT
jgi:hypothetical protein